MNFKLDFDIPPIPHPISIKDPIILTGSCFAENIQEKFEYYKFNSLCNPNGILFNPLSIANSINSYCTATATPDSLLFEADGIWHSWWHHGSIMGYDKTELETKIKEVNLLAHAKLKHAQWLVITWGSAYAYELISNNLLVANCHKVPAHQFKKRLLSVDEITNEYLNLFEKLNSFNPNLKIMLSISPVRYTRDGLHENNLSKATLQLSLNELMKHNSKLVYFPAYEIVNDELRDYRFFEQDFAHPNKLAIDYVWKRFTETCLSNGTINYLRAVEPLLRARQHRPIHANSLAHQQFKTDLLRKTEKLQEEYPDINLQEEIAYFKSK